MAIVGIPFVSPLIGYENDIAPRKVRIVGLTYWSTYVPELDIDPAESLAIVDWGDVDFPFGDTGAAVSAVETVVGEVLEAGCLPVTIGGSRRQLGCRQRAGRSRDELDGGDQLRRALRHRARWGR